MKYSSKLALAILISVCAFSANADPIEVVALSGGEHPTTLGGYELTPFDEPTGTSDCTPFSSGGEVCFTDYYGNAIELPSESPWRWKYPEQGNVFVVGASNRGSAWIQAHDDAGNSTREVDFYVDRHDTRGYGVYTTGCTALTRITVEPFEWGFGYLPSNQGECTTVPEPAAIGLFALGLLGIALARRINQAETVSART